MDDVDRLLLFEWHARHYESLNEWLPPVPGKMKMFRGMPTEEFHAVSIRSAVLRKFFAVGEDESIRLKEVWSVMLTLADPERARFQDDLTDLIGQWDDLLRHAVQYRLGQNDPTDSKSFWTMINHGLLLHGDPRKGRKLREWGSPVVHSALWNAYGIPTLGLTPSQYVLDTLETIRVCRAEGALTIELPEPYEPIWTQYEPTAPDASPS